MRPESPARLRPPLRLERLAACAAAVAVAGCSDVVRASRLEPAGVNVESPAAGAVLAAQSRATPYPTFRDVPPKPTLSPPAQTAGAVVALNGERAAFRTWESENPATLSDTPGFASAAREGLQAQSPAAPPADQVKASTDWARQAREAAKAPFAPPPKP